MVGDAPRVGTGSEKNIRNWFLMVGDSSRVGTALRKILEIDF